jgi:hypothetical protein
MGFLFSIHCPTAGAGPPGGTARFGIQHALKPPGGRAPRLHGGVIAAIWDALA